MLLQSHYFSRFLPNRPRPLSSFDNARWQPVTQSARSRRSYGKIEDCEQSRNNVAAMLQRQKSSLRIVSFNITLKLSETSLLHVLWTKCRTCSRSLFFNTAHFYLALVAASISHFLTAITKIHVVLPTKKKMSPLFFF